jgi:hypothetical protein
MWIVKVCVMGLQHVFLFNALENGTFAEAKGGLGDQTEAAAQAGGGLVPEPQGKR